MMDEIQQNDRAIGRLEGQLSSLTNLISGVSNEVIGLRNDFKTMESGRLSKLELSFATMSAELTVKARNYGFYAGAIASVSSSVVSGVLLYFLLR